MNTTNKVGYYKGKQAVEVCPVLLLIKKINTQTKDVLSLWVEVRPKDVSISNCGMEIPC